MIAKIGSMPGQAAPENRPVLPRTTTSKLSIPRDLMDYWQAWRKSKAYVPQVSHDALFAFTLLTADQRFYAIKAYHDWRDGNPAKAPRIELPPGVCGFVGPLGSETFPFTQEVDAIRG